MPKIPFKRQLQLARYWIEKCIREGRVPETIDIEATLDHLDPELEYDENMRLLYEIIGCGPPWVSPIKETRRRWEKVEDILTSEAVREARFWEDSQRFLDLFPEEESVASLIRAGEIDLLTAIRVYSKYGRDIFIECDFEPDCIVEKYTELEEKAMAKRNEWKIIVEYLGPKLTTQDREILLDPYMPEEVKVGLLEELGLLEEARSILEMAKQKGAITPKPRAEARPTPVRERPRERVAVERRVEERPRERVPGSLEDRLAEVLERMGYGVLKIEKYYVIGQNRYSVMFIDRHGKRHYVTSVEV